jgi:hypothetical protein
MDPRSWLMNNRNCNIVDYTSSVPQTTGQTTALEHTGRVTATITEVQA